MTKRISIGWGVLTRDTRLSRGKTVCAYPHTLYARRSSAEEAASEQRRLAGRNPRYVFDVVEVFIDDEEQSK